MKIKATKKLLNIAGIKATKDPNPSGYELPGEWFASLVSMNRPGKLAIHFLHHPTLLTVVVPGKSLNKALPLLPGRISSLLKRHGYQILEPLFRIHSEPDIFTTDSRSQLGHMNNLKYNIEYHLALAESTDDIEYELIDDIHFNCMFNAKSLNRKYVRPNLILDDFLQKMSKNN